MKAGIVAPSSVLGQVELALGVERLEKSGFEVVVHPQVKKRSEFFSGTDAERAQAIWDYAHDATIDVLWCARGGYGAYRILEILEKWTREKGVPPKKLLVGYSDVTVLLEFVRVRWGWKTLHGPMVGVSEVIKMPEKDWKSVVSTVMGYVLSSSAQVKFPKLKHLSGTPALSRPITAPVVGGNLSCWVSMIGTPFEPKSQGKILFIEEIDESHYRIDRMLGQLAASGGLEGVGAIVLGLFTHCQDRVMPILAVKPKKIRFGQPLSPSFKMKPLRPTRPSPKGVLSIFGEYATKARVPVFYGLPSGHGGGYLPIPIGAPLTLAPDGVLK